MTPTSATRPLSARLQVQSPILVAYPFRATGGSDGRGAHRHPPDAIDIPSLSDEELQRLIQLLSARGNDAWDWSLAPKTLSSGHRPAGQIDRRVPGSPSAAS